VRVDGTAVDEPDVAHCRAVGDALARMHLASTTYRARLSNRRGPSWWRQAARAVKPFLDPSQNDLLAAELKFLSGYGSYSLPKGAIHGDLFCDNVLFVGDRVSGIIDFGDMTFTAIIADVAVTAAEHIPEDCTAGGAAAAQSVGDVANAYHECMPLLPQERAMLGTLVAARLVANVVVHEWHLHHNPAGDHYRPLAADFIRERLAIAAELSLGEKSL